MVAKFRLLESQYLAEAYQDAVQMSDAISSSVTEENEEDVANSVSEVETELLLNILTCYVYAYNKLLEQELIISCSKALTNSKTLH